MLIVDSDAFFAGIYARRFESGGWHVRVAETDKEARKILTRSTPSVVIVDVETIPRGIGFVRELRSHPRSCHSAIVVLTKLGDRASVDEAKKSGADAYLLKGHFVPSEACAKVDRLVAARNGE